MDNETHPLVAKFNASQADAVAARQAAIEAQQKADEAEQAAADARREAEDAGVLEPEASRDDETDDENV